MLDRLDGWRGALRTTVLTVLIVWAILLLMAVALRLWGPVVVWSHDAPFARNSWAPFPGIVFVEEHVREWDSCRRHALMIHEEVHWDQQLRYLLVGMWGPYLAGKYLGVGDFDRRMELEADRAEEAFLDACRG